MNHRRPSRSLTRARGFTVIELLIVVALVGVLTALAVPSFVGMIQRNRVSAEVNSFAGDLQFARSEAIKQGLPVSVCASSNGKTCLGANTWHSGWIVFVDLNGSGTVDNTNDTVSRIRPAWSGGDTFVAAPSMTSVTYSRDGFANLPVGTGTAVLMTLHTAPVNANATRCVSINRVGHHSVLTGGTGGCS